MSRYTRLRPRPHRGTCCGHCLLDAQSCQAR